VVELCISKRWSGEVCVKTKSFLACCGACGKKFDIIIYMSDQITPTKESTQTELVPVETTGSLPITTPSEPLGSSTTTDTPYMANNDNQGIISENNPIIPTESEKPLENQGVFRLREGLSYKIAALARRQL